MNKKQVEIILSKLKPIEKPKLDYEQYSTPTYLAAEIVNLAWLNKDVENKKIADLGCGNGILGLACLLFKAKKVYFVDKDKDVLKIAKENFEWLKKNFKIGEARFFVKDVNDFNLKVDTVIQNPPFGLKSENKDLEFLQKALEIAKRIYSLHGYSEKSRKFLKNFVEARNGKILLVKKYEFQIPRTFKFHEKTKYKYFVDLYVIEKTKDFYFEDTIKKHGT